MQLDPSKCVQCGNLNVKLKTVYSQYLDKRGRFKPNDPFFFCSDDCFEKALDDFYDFENFSGPATSAITARMTEAFQEYHDKHIGDNWYKKNPGWWDSEKREYVFPKPHIPSDVGPSTEERMDAYEKDKEWRTEKLRQAVGRFRKQWLVQIKKPEVEKIRNQQEKERERIEALKRR